MLTSKPENWGKDKRNDRYTSEENVEEGSYFSSLSTEREVSESVFLSGK